MESKVLILLAAAVAVAAAGRHDMYSSNSVHGIKLRNRPDLELLETLESELNLDIWQDGMPVGRDAMVMLTPDNRNIVLEAMDDHEIEHYLQIPNVSKFLEEEDYHLKKWEAQRTDRMIFQGFRRYDEVNKYLESVAREYPNLVTLVNVGKSFQGRDIKYLKISTTNFKDPSKPIYFMDATIHAREWVTTPVALYSIYRLVENLRNEDRDVRDEIDWIILPIVNPDGYEHTHTNKRLWRKTRSVNPSSNCIGVDANRNFDIAFNTAGVSTNPCGDNYPGSVAFSEPETQYIKKIMNEHLNRIQLYINIHSHGNWILYGYGNQTLPPNAAQLHLVGSAMGAAIDKIKLSRARDYAVGNSGMLLYRTSGSAQDYGQHIGIPLSYTLELPGYGFAFSVPAAFVEQINKETWLGIVVSARLARRFYHERYVAPIN